MKTSKTFVTMVILAFAFVVAGGHFSRRTPRAATVRGASAAPGRASSAGRGWRNSAASGYHRGTIPKPRRSMPGPR
jgi:hypothetical protein